MKLKHALIAAAATSAVVATAGPSLADKLQQDTLQAECNPDWGPSTQYIRGQAVKCNMPAPVSP